MADLEDSTFFKQFAQGDPQDPNRPDILKPIDGKRFENPEDPDNPNAEKGLPTDSGDA